MSCCTNTYNLGCFNNCSIIAVGLCLTSGTYNGVFTYGNISTTITVTAIENEPFLFDLSLLNENATFTLAIYDENENQITLTIDSVDYDCFKVKTQVDSVKVTQGTIIGCTPMCKEIYDPNDENTAVLFTVAVDGTTITGDGTVGNPLIAIGGGGGGGIESIVAGDNITIDNTDPLNPIVSASGGGTSALFPNGTKYVEESRELNSSDAGYLLIIFGEDVYIELPEENPFQLGDNVAILFTDPTNYLIKNNDNHYSNSYHGDNSEVMFFTNIEQDGEKEFYLISSSLIEIDENTKKTALRYFYDNQGSFSLFPNGIEFVSASRDFQATDKGKLLILDGEVILTLPEIFPLEENDVIYIMLSGFGSKYQTQYAGNVIEGLSFGNGQPEVVKLGVASLSGNLGFIQLSESAFNNDKTALRYLYDQSQNAISLYSGLESSKQDTLVSGTNIKTINGTTILGSGDMTVGGQVDILQIQMFI